MESSFYIDTGHGATDQPDKKQKKSKSKHKKEKTLEKEPDASNGTDNPTFVYVSSDNILGEEAKKAEGEQQEEGDRPKGRRSAFRRSTNKRYHETGDNSGAMPGILSDALRQALGLNRGQLPFFIYRMRELGYPPGWLKNAEKSGSGELAIFSEDVDVEKPVEYNVDKLIAYPGFNVPLPKGTYDDWRKLRALPMQEHQDLELFRKHLSQGNVYQSGTEEPSTSSVSDRLTSNLGSSESGGKGGHSNKRRHEDISAVDDMEVEEENTEDSSAKNSRLDYTDTGCSSRNSVSSEAELSQLEEERRRIIDQLNSTQADDNESESAQGNGLENECLTEDEDSRIGETSSVSETGVPNAAALGSPVYMSSNVVMKVKDIEKFSQGIEEFRPYVSGEVSGTFQKVMGALKEAKRGASRKSFLP